MLSILYPQTDNGKQLSTRNNKKIIDQYAMSFNHTTSLDEVKTSKSEKKKHIRRGSLDILTPEFFLTNYSLSMFPINCKKIYFVHKS